MRFNKTYFILVICIIIVTIFFKVIKKEESIPTLINQIEKTKNVKNITPQESEKKKEENFFTTSPINNPPEELKLVIIPDDTEKSEERKLKKSLEINKEFTKMAKIKIPFPEDYNYHISETDEDLLIVSGINPNNGSYLNFIAGRQLLTAEEAISSIKEDPDLVQVNPEYHQALQNLKPYQKLTDSSFSDNTIYVYYGQDNDDRGLAVMFGSRADKEGSYMLVSFGPVDVLEKNEENLLYLLKNSEITK